MQVTLAYREHLAEAGIEHEIIIYPAKVTASSSWASRASGNSEAAANAWHRLLHFPGMPADESQAAS